MAANEYRAYQINVLVLVHKSQEEDRDQGIIDSTLTEINELATGDVVVISATPVRVGRL